MTKINTEKELGKALAEEKLEIEIEGSLVNKVLKIKATGKVSWLIAFGAIATAILAVITTIGSGGTASVITIPSKLIAGTTAASILGFSATKSAVLIGVAAGSPKHLSKLRKYEIKEEKDSKLVLKKK